MTECFFGVDVSKGWIDVFDPQDGSYRVAMETAQLGRFARKAAQRGALVVLEATGGYERHLLGALEAEGARWHRANPARARNFARAIGVIGKTDKVDAHEIWGRNLGTKSGDEIWGRNLGTKSGDEIWGRNLGTKSGDSIPKSGDSIPKSGDYTEIWGQRNLGTIPKSGDSEIWGPNLGTDQIWGQYTVSHHRPLR